MDFKKNKKYFGGATAFKVAGIYLIAVGICMIPVLGIGFFIIPVGIGLVCSGKIITDEEYDNEILKNIKSYKKDAMEKLGLDEDEVKEIEPIIMSDYKFLGASKVKKGKDLKWRSNLYEIVIMFFSRDEIHCYRRIINTIENQIFESTDVYFYRDIVSISTDASTEKIGNNVINYSSFKIMTTAGTSLSTARRDSKDVEESIHAMRALIREKKKKQL